MLKVENLFVKYDRADEDFALRGITFSIGKGERAALIGANGAGKSTLLLSIMGVVESQPGSVLFDGEPITPSARKKIGMVFQNPDEQLFMHTVYEDVAFGPRNAGVDENEIARRADETLRLFSISDLKDKPVYKLSGGEKRMAALAGVLICRPGLMLLDEPSSFLDPRGRRNLMEHLAGLPHAMIIATHDMELAKILCSRSIILRNGKIMADGATEKILADKKFLDECGL